MLPIRRIAQNLSHVFGGEWAGMSYEFDTFTGHLISVPEQYIPRSMIR